MGRTSNIDSSRLRLGSMLATAGAVSIVGTAAIAVAPAAAAPAPVAVRGLPEVANDVLGPADPEFWNPAYPGTRILTPVDPHDEVVCLTGFVPVLNCWTKNRHELAATPRPLAHVDVPMIGEPPLRIWVDLPRWGDGPTGEDPIRQLTNDVVIWWLTNPTTS